MNLIPWKTKQSLDVFDDFDNFQQDMNRLMNRSFFWPMINQKNGMGFPHVDIIDQKDGVRIKADLPGLKKEDIDVSTDNGVLTIKGEKKEEREVKEKDYLRSECFYGSFHRSFMLPAGVDAEHVNASYKDGVLEITLPKREEAKAKQINIDIK